MSTERSVLVSQLREAISALDGVAAPVVPFGTPVLDRRLAAGGLSVGSVHEVAAASPCLTCDAAATLFLAGAAARFATAGGRVLWALTRFDLYAPGLEQAGLAAARTIYAQGRDDAEALALAEDALAHGGEAAGVAEVARAGLTVTRRLQLAAERHSIPVMLLRRWRRRDACPLVEASAAVTRWRIGTAPSARSEAPGVGRASWTVELVRQRGGEPFSLILEACDGEGRLAPPAAAADRAVAQGGAPAARAA
jgi:protein ImuA